MSRVSVAPGILELERPPAKRPGLEREIGFIGLLCSTASRATVPSHELEAIAAR